MLLSAVQCWVMNEQGKVLVQRRAATKDKSLIEAICLPKDNLNSQTIANMNKMIVMAETPYKKGGQLVFPIIEYERY